MSDWKRSHGQLPDNWTPVGSELVPTEYALRCDAHGCEEISPWSDAVYFETGGALMARALAEQHGWSVRILMNDAVRRDFCPAHAPRRM